MSESLPWPVGCLTKDDVKNLVGGKGAREFPNELSYRTVAFTRMRMLIGLLHRARVYGKFYGEAFDIEI